MFAFESMWFFVPALVGLLVWGFLVWLAWLLVTSVRGMHAELRRIREVLELSARPGA